MIIVISAGRVGLGAAMVVFSLDCSLILPCLLSSVCYSTTHGSSAYCISLPTVLLLMVRLVFISRVASLGLVRYKWAQQALGYSKAQSLE